MEIKCWCSSSSVPHPEFEGEYFFSSVQHGVQLVGQVIKHVTDVVQDGPGRSDRVGAAAENKRTHSRGGFLPTREVLPPTERFYHPERFHHPVEEAESGLPVQVLLLVQFSLNCLQSCCQRRAGLIQSLLCHLSSIGRLR